MSCQPNAAFIGQRQPAFSPLMINVSLKGTQKQYLANQNRIVVCFWLTLKKQF